MKNLKELTNLFGPSGFENEVAEWFFSKMKKCRNVDNVVKDKIGNVYAEIKGKSPRKVILSAHSDEVGFIITYIDDNGFIKFDTVGGIDKKILPNTKVIIKGENDKKIKGVIGLNPPHAGGQDKVLEVKELFIDTGLSKKELEKLDIFIGCTATFDTEFEKSGDYYIGKAFDDRVGVSVLTHIAENLKNKPDFTLVLAVVVQEELGLRGGEVASKTVEPEFSLVFEGTFAMDTPGNTRENWSTYSGKGPALTLFDRSMAADRKLVGFIKKIAEKNKISWQYKQPRNAGGTDAGKYHLGKNGVPSAVIAAPCRYIHSAYGMLNKNDYENMKKLGLSIVENFKISDIDKLYK
ncbi:MAG: M28 family peptidase [Candidatus Muiribacteriota bacterium]